MEKDLSNFRQIYSLDELLEKDILQNPMEQFQKWFFEAQNSDTEREANAMSVATLGKDGFPKTRVVLLKKYTHEGFIFYSNYLSEKGKAIEENPHICLSFFWAGLERQVIIKGIAEKLAENLSDGYFESRPRGSQLGAIVSEQSSIIPSREYLQEKLSLLEKKYENQDIPRPAFWGGYLVRPISIEFWQGRPNRLHDRIRYSLTNTYDWKIERLSP
jgi:pyridoxamine 5'-phosphate oxidase